MIVDTMLLAKADYLSSSIVIEFVMIFVCRNLFTIVCSPEYDAINERNCIQYLSQILFN